MTFLVDSGHGLRRKPVRRISLGALLSLRRQRRQLARLDERALTDIGVSRAEALREARRPIWDVPGHWRG